MKLKTAICDAKEITCSIHVSDGWSHQAKISKKDALIACEDYLMKSEEDENSGVWENEAGSIVAMILSDGRLSIGR